MDTVTTYRTVIRDVLVTYTAIHYAYGDIRNEVVFDDGNDRYLIVSIGWQGSRRIHGCLLHVEILAGKVWIQRDGTEEGIALELVAAGIPKQNIVLGFQGDEVRPYTEFAAF